LVQEWKLRLTYLMLETLGALRSSDMFDIVIDFPDSAPALQDLAVCLQHTSLAGHFAASFKAALQQRLLHAGAATADIIHTYVSTIRAMQQVDNSGEPPCTSRHPGRLLFKCCAVPNHRPAHVITSMKLDCALFGVPPAASVRMCCAGLLLELVSEPIRAYLRSRPDTIRCIVSMLTEDPSDSAATAGGTPGSSLLEELQHQQQHQAQQGTASSAGGAPGAFAAAGGAAAAAEAYGLAAAATAGGGSVGSGAAAAASAAARASYNWCIGEAEGDEAALRLLEALEAGPAAPAIATGPGGSIAAGGGAQGQQQATHLGLPISAPSTASAALAGSSLSARGDADVVSMLIGVYGGPLLFIEEYRRMLADRLLAKEEYDCVKEIRTLELLKIRRVACALP
jgi:anaphase-promoting complex subunit 2